MRQAYDYWQDQPGNLYIIKFVLTIPGSLPGRHCVSYFVEPTNGKTFFSSFNYFARIVRTKAGPGEASLLRYKPSAWIACPGLLPVYYSNQNVIISSLSTRLFSYLATPVQDVPPLVLYSFRVNCSRPDIRESRSLSIVTFASAHGRARWAEGRGHAVNKWNRDGLLGPGRSLGRSP